MRIGCDNVKDARELIFALGAWAKSDERTAMTPEAREELRDAIAEVDRLLGRVPAKR